MRFEAVDVKNFIGYKETKIQRIIKEFKNAEIPIAEVKFEAGEYSSVSAAYSALIAGIKRMNVGNVTTRVKSKKLYLINNTLYEDAVKNEVK